MSYIYVIINDINGKQYVGKTNYSIEKRFKEHIRDSKKERCEKRPLYDAMNKYGIEHFSIEQLEECLPEETATRERYWIDKLNTYYNGYNATCGGDGKILYDYNVFVEEYQKGKTIKQIAQEHNCCEDTVSIACHNAGLIIRHVDNGTMNKPLPIAMLDKQTENIVQTFDSIANAARFLAQNKSGLNLSGIRSHISQVCRGVRNSAYGYKWKYI